MDTSRKSLASSHRLRSQISSNIIEQHTKLKHKQSTSMKDVTTNEGLGLDKLASPGIAPL